AMDSTDSLPFSVISFGQGQLIAFLPRGADNLRRLVDFARKYPEIFNKFFPTVNVDDIVAGGYSLVNEPAGDTSPSETPLATPPSTPPSSPPGSPPSSQTLTVTADDEADDERPLVRPSAASGKLLAEFRAAHAALNGATLSFPELVRTGQCFLDSTYRDEYVQRSIKDRDESFSWDRRAPVPANPHKLTGAAYRSFLSTQGLPGYVAPTRFDSDFTPRTGAVAPRRTPTIQLVKGGTFLWRLTRDPTPLDLAYSTAGTTVIPEIGRTYTFEELYPEDQDTYDEGDSSDGTFSFTSSPSRSVWGSSSTIASPGPSSQERV
ncbi:hypothetical protein K523DRAFT_253858, partial [Schizophyllum commune Tattone D]